MLNPVATLWRGFRQTRRVQRDHHVSVLTQLAQLATVRRDIKAGRAEYFKYRLWRPELSAAERLTYTSQRERRVTEALTNPEPEHDAVPRGKSALAQRLSAAGLPGSELLGWIAPAVSLGMAPSAASRIMSADALADLFAQRGAGGIVLKPDHGMQGDGIMVAPTSDASGITLLSGDTIPVESLWRRLAHADGEGWRIERWVRPHPELAAFRPGATPTVRVLTLIVGGETIVHAATLKVPRGSLGVDNLAKGNLVAAVDLATGVVGPATDGSGEARFDRHPETGVPITGTRIPGWAEVRALACAGAPVMAPWRAIGWDIAVTDGGPVILEGNRRWCEKLVQLPAGRGLTRGAFIRLLHEMGGAGVLEARRRHCAEWAAFERDALQGTG